MVMDLLQRGKPALNRLIAAFGTTLLTSLVGNPVTWMFLFNGTPVIVRHSQVVPKVPKQKHKPAQAVVTAA